MPPTTLSAAAVAELDALLQNAVARGDLPNVVATVATADSTLYEGAVGASPNTIFRIASMTKPVTSVAVMMLCERGLLALDDPLEQYLPHYAGREVINAFDPAGDSYNTRPAASPVTLRHLLSHTSGFGYSFCNETLAAITKDNNRSPKSLPLLYDPGTAWSYSCSTAILGDVIDQVTGEPFYHFLEAEILKPLGMEETSYFVEGERLDRLTPLHFRQERSWIKDPSTRPHTPYLSADSGLLGTARNYIRFLQMLLNEGQLAGTRLLGAASVREMMRNQIGALTVVEQPASDPASTRPFPHGAGIDKFGLGFQIKTEAVPHSRLPGSGSWGGIFNTHFWIDPQAGVAAVFFTQLLPFYDEQVIGVLAEFEAAIYRHLA
jgi:CubicO group peptidase (beta-lactamase class C family)